VIGSRLLVLVAAILGSTLRRAAGWQVGDPQHLTLKLGAVGNALAAAAVRWDSVHYLAIAEHGYKTPVNTPFFPLYPLLIKALSWLPGSYVVAGVLVSAVAFAVALRLLHQLTREQFGKRAADATVLLLAFSPVSLFFTAIYTESLFLALALATFVLARRGRFGWAGAAATAATLTHIEGVLLIAPLVIFYWQDQRTPGLLGSGRQRLSIIGRGAALFSPLLALGGFCIYLHSLGYGWLAPSSDEHYYQHHLTGPVTGFAEGVRAAATGLAGLISGSASDLTARQNAFENLMYLAVLIISFATLAMAWRSLPKAYSVYSALCLLVCISSPVASAEPLTSLDRYVLVLFPLWMVAAKWLSERQLLRATLAGSGTLLCVFALEFARWVFFG
jgi:hypothetical protein